MTLTKILLILLVLIGAGMIYLGINANMKPPTLTGIGFIIIAFLFLRSEKRKTN